MTDEELYNQKFVNAVDGLGVFSAYQFVKTGGVASWVRQLKSAASGDIKRAQEIMRELIEVGKRNRKMPEPWDLDEVAERLYPRSGRPIAPLDCKYCNGTGFEVVERAGLTGADRCRLGHAPPVDGGKPPEDPIKDRRALEMAGVKI